MNTFVENSYFGKGFPNDPILKDKNMIVRTDVDEVRKVVKTCLKPEISPLVNSALAKKGFTIKDRLLRPSLVGVSKKSPKKDDKTQQNEEISEDK